MSSEHPPAERLVAYGRRTLVPRELLAVDDHLAVCDACRRQLGTAVQLNAVVASVDAVLRSEDDAPIDHVEYEQLARYVTGTLRASERGVVDAHVEVCDQCAEELRDLQAFAGTMTRGERNPSIDARSANLLEWIRSLALVPRPALQGAFGMVALALVVVVIWQQLQFRHLEERAASLSASAEALANENESLRGTAESLQATNRSLSERIAATAAAARGSVPAGGSGVGARSIRDTSGTAVVSASAPVMLLADAPLPDPISESARELLMGGEVSLVEEVAPKLMALRTETTRSTVPNQPVSAAVPVPLRPAFTGVRSTTPTLEWSATPAAREYRVTVAGEDGGIVWESSAGTDTRLAVPSSMLQRDRVHPLASGSGWCWRRSAIAGGAILGAP